MKTSTLPAASRSASPVFRPLGEWRLKTFGIPAFIAAFFAGYFLLLKYPVFPFVTMPLTPVDSWIGFQPQALGLYFSLWAYTQIVPFLISERRELVFFGWAAGVLSVVGFLFFFFWPTAVPRADIEWSQHPGFEFLKSADTAGNACPSLHVAFSIFNAVWLRRLLLRYSWPSALHVVNWLWCAGIVYSTLATKQHVFLDVIAGAGLGLAVGLARPRVAGQDSERASIKTADGRRWARIKPVAEKV